MADGQRIVALPYKPRNWAKPFHASLKRWSALVLHRRAGKTTALMQHHQRAAMDDDWEKRRLLALMPDLTDRHLQDLLKGRHYGHVMPSYKQAKLVAWDMLKDACRGVDGAKTNEVDLSVTYKNGNWVRLFGADNPDSLRGPAFSGLSFDEYSQHPPNIFGEVLSKALADHLGYGVFAGTIKGKNQLWKAFDGGKADPEWFAIWQDINQSLATETDASTLMLRQAMRDDQALIAKGLMTQEEYDQEWFLSTEAAIKGAYYAKQLAAARRDGRITRVPYEPMLPVDTDWDLGVSDSTTIWFTQSIKTGEIRAIDYYENSGEGMPHYIQVLKERGYTYGKHWGPHDIQVREFGTGKSRVETARSLGFTFDVTPNIGLKDGIDAARLVFPRCYFDEKKCEVGLAALTQYRKGWNEGLQEFKDTPVHDWSSHGADSFRGMAVRHKLPRDKAEVPSSVRIIHEGGSRGLGWMR